MSEHYDFHYQPTGSGAISGQQVLEQTEDAINELGDYVNDNVGGAMDVAQQALETAQNAEQDAQTALDTANSFSSAIQSAQQDASTALSTAQTAQTTASNANNTALQAQQDASSAVTTANNASGQVSTLSGTVTALGQRVTTAEGNIGQNTSDITALTTRVGTAEGNITTLQNDVSIAMGNASSAMATAGTVKQQAYVFRYSSTALVASSTNSNALLDNTDNLKVGDKVIDSDGVLFSITAIDTVNSTFTIGSALVDLALDTNVVHTSGNENVGGSKTFLDGMGLNSWLFFTNSSVTKGTIPQSTVNPYRIYFGSGVNYGASLFNIDTSVSNTGVQSFIFRSAENVVSGDDARFALIYDPNRIQPRYLTVKGNIEPNLNNTYDSGSNTNIWKDLYVYHGYFRGQQQNDEYSGNARTNLTLLANRDTVGTSGCLIDTFRENTTQGTGSHIIGFGIRENSVRYEGCRFSWLWDNNLNGYSFSFRPTLQGANQAVEHNLGLSTDKWDTINGLEPSSLSMPDLSNGIDISSYITIGDTDSNYTPSVNGWIWIRLIGNGASIIQGDFGINSSYVTNNLTNEKWVETNLFVTKDVQATIRCRGITGIVSAKFYPCLGNV